MPKSRKTKAKYKDFQKVKLKVGKTLPKADNITNTSFKSRSIHIKEQLKTNDASGEPSTRRKQDFYDLLSHCQHHNVSMRHEAVTGLREIVTTDPNVLRTHLAALLERIPGLSTDRDHAVRHAVHRFFKAALPNVPESTITPFFTILSAHLCCAMTHIDDDIQIDSLLLLDLYIEHYPHLVVTADTNLLTNFIEQISRKSNAPGGPGSKSAVKGGRVLLVNPNSKLSSRKGRVQVLERLCRFLRAVVDQKQALLVTGVTSLSHQTFQFSEDTAAYHQPFGSSWFNAHNMHRLEHKVKYTAMSGIEVLSSGPRLGALLDVLFPLMLQCWIEVGPAQLSTDLPGNVMSREAMSTLGNILQVIHLLLQCVTFCDTDTDGNMMQTVRETYLSDFIQYYLPFFPYSMHEVPTSDKKKATKLEPMVSVLSLNLMVCEVMSYFAAAPRGDTSPAWLAKLTTFSCKCSKQGLDFDQLQSLLRFVDKLLCAGLNYDKQEELMTCVCALFLTRHRLSRDRLLLLDFISRHVTSANRTHLLKMPRVANWLASLPQILVQSCGQSNDVTMKIVDIIRRIAPLGQMPILEALQEDCLDLIGVLHSVPSGLQGDLVEVLYWVPTWTRRHLEGLACATHLHQVHPPNLYKLLLGLVYRYWRGRENGDTGLAFEHVDFFSFVLAVIIGRCKEDLLKLNDVGVDMTKPTTRTVFEPDLLEIWSTRMAYTEVLGSILVQLPNTNQVISLFGPAASKLVETYSRLPLPTLVSLLRVTTRLHQSNGGLVVSQHSAVVMAMVAAVTEVVTVTEEADSGANQVSWPIVRDATLAACSELLAASPDTVISITSELLRGMADCGDGRAAFGYGYVLSRFHRDAQLRPAMVGHGQAVRTVLNQLQEKLPELQTQAWWSDLKYEVSLVQPK